MTTDFISEKKRKKLRSSIIHQDYANRIDNLGIVDTSILNYQHH